MSTIASIAIHNRSHTVRGTLFNDVIYCIVIIPSSILLDEGCFSSNTRKVQRRVCSKGAQGRIVCSRVLRIHRHNYCSEYCHFSTNRRHRLIFLFSLSCLCVCLFVCCCLYTAFKTCCTRRLLGRSRQTPPHQSPSDAAHGEFLAKEVCQPTGHFCSSTPAMPSMFVHMVFPLEIQRWNHAILAVMVGYLRFLSLAPFLFDLAC